MQINPMLMEPKLRKLDRKKVFILLVLFAAAVVLATLFGWRPAKKMFDTADDTVRYQGDDSIGKALPGSYAEWLKERGAGQELELPPLAFSPEPALPIDAGPDQAELEAINSDLSFPTQNLSKGYGKALGQGGGANSSQPNPTGSERWAELKKTLMGDQPASSSGASFGKEGIGILDDTQRAQRLKSTFMNNPQGDAELLKQWLKTPPSPYMVMAGTLIPALLVTGINSDLPGQIIAQVREPVYDSVSGRYLLVPQGTRILGRYDNMISRGQKRVLLAWSRIIYPDGSSIHLEGMPAADLAGYSGLKDKVDNHYLQLATAVLFSSFLSAGAGYYDGDDEGFEQELRDTIARDTNQSGQELVKRQLRVAPTIRIRPGMRCNIVVNRDMVLKPYGE